MKNTLKTFCSLISIACVRCSHALFPAGHLQFQQCTAYPIASGIEHPTENYWTDAFFNQVIVNLKALIFQWNRKKNLSLLAWHDYLGIGCTSYSGLSRFVHDFKFLITFLKIHKNYVGNYSVRKKL